MCHLTIKPFQIITNEKSKQEEEEKMLCVERNQMQFNLMETKDVNKRKATSCNRGQIYDLYNCPIGWLTGKIENIPAAAAVRYKQTKPNATNKLRVPKSYFCCLIIDALLIYRSF